MSSILALLLPITLWILIPVLLVSGIIRLRRFGLKCFDEYQRTRLEVGKIAEEMAMIRKKMEGNS